MCVLCIKQSKYISVYKMSQYFLLKIILVLDSATWHNKWPENHTATKTGNGVVSANASIRFRCFLRGKFEESAWFYEGKLLPWWLWDLDFTNLMFWYVSENVEMNFCDSKQKSAP